MTGADARARIPDGDATAFPVRPTTASPARVRLLGWWYVAEHYVRHMRAYALSELVIGIGTPALYVLAFGTGLGVVVDASSGGVDGVPYLVFLAPALLCSAVLMTAAQQYTYTVFSGLKWQPIITAMAATPLRPWHVVGGLVTVTVIRVLPATAAFVLLIALVGAVDGPGALLLFPIAALLVCAALPIMAWVASQREDRGQLGFVERFVIMPLVLFSGTYYPLDVLPQPLQAIGWCSPLWHAVELGRSASYGHDLGAWPAAAHVAVLLAFAAVGAIASERILRKRLHE